MALNLDPAVKPREIAASTDALGYGKKVLITNKVTTNFFPTPITPLATTLSTSSTAESRLKNTFYISHGKQNYCQVLWARLTVIKQYLAKLIDSFYTMLSD